MDEHSAGFILYNEGKFLILHYEEGHWDFPKGRVEPGETIKEAALREVKEETGIDELIIFEDFEEDIHYSLARDGERRKKRVDFFFGKTSVSLVTLSPEHIGYTWLPFEEALDKVTYRNAKEVLTKANAFICSQE